MELKQHTCTKKGNRFTLLIVPYGIETPFKKSLAREARNLLIVPYGIETKQCCATYPATVSFNRTLWN